MKKLLLLPLIMFLSACNPNHYLAPLDYHGSRNLFSVICLDGIEYWVRSGYQKGYLAVKIDSKTLQPSTCKND